MTRPRPTGDAELLDGDSLSLDETERALGDLVRTHRWLFGYGSVLRTLTPHLAAAGSGARLLDVGTGAGDVADRVARYLRRRGVEVQVVGVDRKLSHLLFGRRRGFAQLRVVADVAALPFRDGVFDWALANLLLHHFEPAAGRRLLQRLQRHARGVAVIDLRRARGSVLVVRAALGLLGIGRVARHDGIVSSRRAWSTAQVRAAIDGEPVELRRRFPMRFSLILHRPAERTHQSPEVRENPGAISPSHPGS